MKLAEYQATGELVKGSDGKVANYLVVEDAVIYQPDGRFEMIPDLGDFELDYRIAYYKLKALVER